MFTEDIIFWPQKIFFKKRMKERKNKTKQINILDCFIKYRWLVKTIHVLCVRFYNLLFRCTQFKRELQTYNWIEVCNEWILELYICKVIKTLNDYTFFYLTKT